MSEGPSTSSPRASARAHVVRLDARGAPLISASQPAPSTAEPQADAVATSPYLRRSATRSMRRRRLSVRRSTAAQASASRPLATLSPEARTAPSPTMRLDAKVPSRPAAISAGHLRFGAFSRKTSHTTFDSQMGATRSIWRFMEMLSQESAQTRQAKTTRRSVRRIAGLRLWVGRTEDTEVPARLTRPIAHLPFFCTGTTLVGGV